MAKVGNEARLILELAHDRICEAEIVADAGKEHVVSFMIGYRQALAEYTTILRKIVTELEKG